MKAACLRNLTGLLGLAIAATWCGTAEAATLILGASNQSRYDANGVNWLSETTSDEAPIGNTLTGWRGNVESRSYFVFDVSAVSAPVTGATLRLLNKRYYSTENTEAIELFDVTTPTSELVGSAGSTDIFEDLGTGAAYGGTTLVATPPTNDFDNVVQTYFEVVLTQAAIDGINQAAAQGEQYFAIGIRLGEQDSRSPYTFTCETLDGVIVPPPDCTLRGLQVEGALFSGGILDPLRDSEEPGELILSLQEPQEPIGIPESSTVLSLMALGVSGGVLKMRSWNQSRRR